MWSFKVKAALGIAGTILLAWTAMSVYNAGYRAGESKIQAKWDAEVSAMALAQAAELERAMAKTAELQAQVQQITRSHRNEIARINARHAAAIDGVRDRPERPDSGGVPEGASVGTGSAGCTGAELYRPDAEFLIGIARDADRLRLALAACIAHSREIERAVNGD